MLSATTTKFIVDKRTEEKKSITLISIYVY